MQRACVTKTAVIVAVAACFCLGLFFPDLRGAAAQGGLAELHRRARGARAPQLEPADVYARVLAELKTHYHGELPPEIELTYGAIRGVLRSLDDPYTRFLDPEEYREMDQDNSGSFVGIGAVLHPEPTPERYIRIIKPYPNTPAANAGIQPGDLITHVDGKSVVGMTVDEVVKRIRGQPNTRVRLTIRRTGVDRPLEFSIVRQPVEYPVVEYEMKPGGIGYLSIMWFYETTDSRLERAIADLDRQGMKALILDLRDNPGGLLKSAVEVASRFVPPGRVITSVVTASGTQRERAIASQYLDPRWPIVVLVNRGSASASEIVAAAIQDYGIGTIVGTTTFGKGLVQQIVRLPDGSALMVTIAKYLSAKGREINRTPEFRGGVTPDIEVEITEEDYRNRRDSQLERAIALLREKIGEPVPPAPAAAP